MDDWLKIVLIVAAVAVVLAVALHFINRSFREKYGFGLYGGALLMLVFAAGVVGGIFLIKDDRATLGFAAIVVGAIALLITLVYDIKKCGAAGFLALLLQIVFCLPALFVVFDLVFNRGRNTIAAPTHYYSKKGSGRRREEDEY